MGFVQELPELLGAHAVDRNLGQADLRFMIMVMAAVGIGQNRSGR